MSKYSEVSSSTEVNASAPCAVEFGLKANFPDDKQQTYPATDIPFKARTPQGTVEGTLDSNGEVIISDVGIGNVTIEVLPDIDKEIEGLQKEIKVALDELINQEKAQAQAIEDEYNKSNWIERRGKDIASIASGIWGFIKGVFGALWAIVTGVGEALVAISSEVGEYLLDPLNAPETFKKDVAAVKVKYEALRKFADEDLETYFIFASDEKTWDIFQTFGKEYLDAQHYSEIMEGGTEAVLGVILTIITAGAGGAAAAGAAGSRLAAVASKLAPVVQKLSKAITDRARFKRRETVQANTRVETVVVMRLRKKRVKCFCATNSQGYKDLKTDKERNKYLKDYQRQLDDQQEAINSMSAKDFQKARSDFKEFGRNPAAANEQAKVGNKFVKDVQNSLIPEMERNNPNLGIKEIKALAKEKAKEIKKGLAALHNPDNIAGGYGKPKPEKMGSASINSSIGSRWDKDNRMDDIDNYTNENVKSGEGNSKMNLEMKVCKKKDCSE